MKKEKRNNGTAEIAEEITVACEVCKEGQNGWQVWKVGKHDLPHSITHVTSEIDLWMEEHLGGTNTGNTVGVGFGFADMEIINKRWIKKELAFI